LKQLLTFDIFTSKLESQPLNYIVRELVNICLQCVSQNLLWRMFTWLPQTLYMIIVYISRRS